MARPRKPEDEKVIRECVAFRPDQAEKIRDLQAKKMLSTVCQEAVDEERV